MTQMEPVVDCSKAQTLLSDLLDVRRGEQPTPLESPLGNPQVLQALDQHLSGCEACRQELQDLDELGLAFSEFNLGEPEEAHFSGYGRMVHARLRRMTRRTAIHPAIGAGSQWRVWLSAVAASSAAAVLAVVLLGPRGQTTSPLAGVPEETPTLPATNEKTEEVAVANSDTRIQDQLADTSGIMELPRLDRRPLNMMLWDRDGMQEVTVNPDADAKSPVVGLPARPDTFVLGEPRSSGLIGIMLKATRRDEDPAEGLCVTAVKRGGPADAIGLKPDDRLLSLNGISFAESSPSEILKFFSAVTNLGHGKLIQVDFARRNTRSGDWLVMRGRAELGIFR